MSYYEGIADQWERVTGRHGGPFKRRVLNDVLLDLVGDVAFAHALAESARVLAPGGRLVPTVVHPSLVHALDMRGDVVRRRARLLMRANDGLLLPVVRRSLPDYVDALRRHGFDFETHDVVPSEAWLALRTRRHAGRLPVALVFDAAHGRSVRP